MKNILVASILALAAAVTSFAEATDVAVLYNGNTPVNTDALHFMSKQFADRKVPYRLKPFKDAGKLSRGDYRAVLVLNSGLSSGIDRTLAEYVAAQEDKSRIILISLRKNSKEVTVKEMSASPATLGVDAITAASAWTGKGLGSLVGGKGSATYEMHVDWVDRVIALIGKR